MPRMKHALLAVALISTLGVFGAACGDDDDGAESSSTSQSSIDAVSAHLQQHEQMIGLIAISGLGLHAMDESLAAGTIEPTFSSNTLKAVRILALTDWDDSVQADATIVHDHAVDLLHALEDEDVEAASAAATALHDSEHEFSESVWAIVAKDLPPGEGGVEEHEDEAESETPGAESHDEPTAEATP